MAIIAYIQPTKRAAARQAVKVAKAAAPKPDCQPDRLRDATMNGYLTGELFPRRDEVGNRRGEALALQNARADDRPRLIKAGCLPGPAICPSFFAPPRWGSGRSHVGLPVGLWNDSGPDVAIARHEGWKPRPAWDAIEAKPMPAAPAWESVWTIDGWKPRRLF